MTKRQVRGTRNEVRGRRQVRGSRFEDRENTVEVPPELRTSHLVPQTCSGFTLLELLVVIVIISVAAALVAPRLPAVEARELQGSARKLAAALRHLEERSVAEKSAYRLRLNISANSVRISRKLASGDETAPDERLLARDLLGSGISITDVTTSRLGKVSDGEVILDIGGAGLTEFLVIHLASAAGQAYTVAAFPNNGRVKVVAGYEELTL